jgi:hypothetical protein
VSHKIYKNNAARQQAYRDRLAAVAKKARMASYAAAEDHGKHQQPDPVCIICNPKNTVTPTQLPVTVSYQHKGATA